MDSRRRARPALLIAGLAAGCAAACAGRPEREAARSAPASPSCALRLIVGFRQAPDEALLGDLGRASGARLEIVSVISPDRLYVLTLGADGAAAACAAAADRLRRDPRVGSVDVDRRRAPQPG